MRIVKNFVISKYALQLIHSPFLYKQALFKNRDVTVGMLMLAQFGLKNHRPRRSKTPSHRRSASPHRRTRTADKTTFSGYNYKESFQDNVRY